MPQTSSTALLSAPEANERLRLRRLLPKLQQSPTRRQVTRSQCTQCRRATRLALIGCCSSAARRYGGRGRGRAQSIDAPFAAAGDPEIEEYEAVDDCQFPAVEQREETSRRMHHEIGDRHVAPEDKGDGAGEQTQRE